MTFAEILEQVRTLLQQKGRISYRALKLQFHLDDEYVEGLKDELIEAERIAVDEDGKVLVWVGAGSEGEKGKGRKGENDTIAKVAGSQSLVLNNTPSLSQDAPLQTQHSAGERRQLTVMFCDLVGSTALSAHLDPEDLREVVRAYQQSCAEVIHRHEGHIAQYLGDGILVYFGYPTAHEDDARRAVRAGVEIVQALQTAEGSNPRLPSAQHDVLEDVAARRMTVGRSFKAGLQVRIGIHTGLVVIGDMGASGRTEQLALGETPNIAARIQGLADPNTVLISAATQRVVEGQFECQPFGAHVVKGIEIPLAVYHVQSERQQASPLVGKTTLTPLVGRDQEVGLLLDRWEQVKEGQGQVVLLSGEPGIGKSRLAHTLKEQVTSEGSLLYEARCSLYYQQSALYPLIEMMQRTLLFTRQDTDDEKIAKLERALALYDMQETLPLLTALLSLPTPSHYPPLTLTPQKQKERTLQALLQLLVVQAERQATVSVWEDLHWADPSSLEFLSLLIEQIPTTKLLLVLTFRPEFTPPWKPHSHLSQLMLNRLGKKQVEGMIAKVAGGKELSAEVIEQIRVKTDGVPLFVEELTKSVVESVGATGRSPLQTLAIPATLQEALLARLDRLSTARQIAQLGATLGREFSYELLRAVTPLTESELQTALSKLVEAEILYQRGIGEQALYFFKHALIQDTAYQSLLKSRRQQLHQQIAHILEDCFPETREHQPELLAHHCTEAGLIERAIPYWQQAGERATQRSAHAEAVNHLTKGLELLKTLPDTPDRVQQEITLLVTLGSPLSVIRGYGAAEVERVYAQALELCRHIGETAQLFPVLWGLHEFYVLHGSLQTGYELAKDLLQLAQGIQDSSLLLEAHHALWGPLVALGEYALAREHAEQGIAFYDSAQHHPLTFLYGGHDPGVCCRSGTVFTLWSLGYPDQAMLKSIETLNLAQKLGHSVSTAQALFHRTILHLRRGEGKNAQDYAEAMITLSTEQRFPEWLAIALLLHGGALVLQGRIEQGIEKIHQGLRATDDTGSRLFRSYYLALLAEAYGKAGQAEEGLGALSEALTLVDKTGERFWEAELHRLKGELTLQSGVQKETEACFLRAIKIAQRQQGRSLELRASTSLAHLWQQQGKRAEAHKLLAYVYNWFTEGFDTKDLQEAQALLAELSR